MVRCSQIALWFSLSMLSFCLSIRAKTWVTQACLTCAAPTHAQEQRGRENKQPLLSLLSCSVCVAENIILLLYSALYITSTESVARMLCDPYYTSLHPSLLVNKTKE